MRDEISLAGRGKQGGKLTQMYKTKLCHEKKKITILKNNTIMATRTTEFQNIHQ